MPWHDATRKEATVEAVHYDGDLVEVVELVGADFRWDGSTLSVRQAGSGIFIPVNDGDWVVPNARGFDVLPGDIFAAQYEVTESPKEAPVRSGGDAKPAEQQQQGDMLVEPA